MQSVQPPAFFKIFSLAVDTQHFRHLFRKIGIAPLSRSSTAAARRQSEAAPNGAAAERPRHGDDGTAG
jgi:hypothetical protein